MVLNFTKKEFGVVFITLSVIIAVTFSNLQVSFRRARDVQRKGDLRAIYNGLVAYREDIASFPASDDGKIVACFGGVDEKDIPQRKPCEWREDKLRDIFYDYENPDNDYPSYIGNLPADPHYDKGVEYVYLSNGRNFQVLTALEGGESEPEYSPGIVARNIMCGSRICNYGLANGDTPLDISVEEYEDILRMKNN